MNTAQRLLSVATFALAAWGAAASEGVWPMPEQAEPWPYGFGRVEAVRGDALRRDVSGHAWPVRVDDAPAAGDILEVAPGGEVVVLAGPNVRLRFEEDSRARLLEARRWTTARDPGDPGVLPGLPGPDRAEVTRWDVRVERGAVAAEAGENLFRPNLVVLRSGKVALRIGRGAARLCAADPETRRGAEMRVSSGTARAWSAMVRRASEIDLAAGQRTGANLVVTALADADE